MTKNKKILIGVFGSLMVIGGVWWAINKRKQKKLMSGETKEQPLPKTTPKNSGGSPYKDDQPVKIGKTAYAKNDNVQVREKAGDSLLGKLYKVAKKGEWIGVVYDEILISGVPFFKVSGSKYVLQSAVDLK
jgi:hypothetical protein